MATNKRADRTVFAVALLGSLVALNIIGLKLFGRLDLTTDHEYTLSSATRSMLGDLKDPVTVKAYFTRDLPPPYSSNARYVADLLDEYYAASSGNFRFEFINPEAEETDADKEKKKDVKTDIFGRAVREPTSVERELMQQGIQPVQVQVNEGDKLEVKRAYMGLAVKFGDKTESIPVVRSTVGLEYDLTTMIRKMTRTRAPKVALLMGPEGQEAQQAYGHMLQMLRGLYEVNEVSLATATEVPQDSDALIVLSPRAQVSDTLKASIQSFIGTGRSVALLLDPVKADLQMGQADELNHGLKELVQSLGVTIGEGLVIDANCAMLNVSQQRGMMRVTQPVKFPFMPLPEGLDANHPLTRGLAQVAFPFMAPLSLSLPANSPIKGEVLVKSSDESFIVKAPYNLDPFQKWSIEGLSDKGSKGLLIALTGPAAAFANPSAPAGDGPQSRVLVTGGAGFVSDQFMGKGSETLILNLMDWLVLDEELLAVRSRGLRAAPIADMSDGKRASLKWLNIAGVPLLFVGFGLVRWRLRERRRATVTL